MSIKQAGFGTGWTVGCCKKWCDCLREWFKRKHPYTYVGVFGHFLQYRKTYSMKYQRVRQANVVPSAGVEVEIAWQTGYGI
jgi:hypothetical protein